MKTINNTKKIAIAFFSLFIIGFSQPSFSKTNTQDPIQFAIISNLSNSPIFELKVANNEVSGYLVSIKDGDGNLLYTEKLKGKSLIRKYRFDINTELTESFDVTFEVTNIKTNKTFVYKATSSRRIIEDIIIAKL